MITGLQSGFISQHLPQLSSSSGLLPSCPPYWMMFSSPQQSRLASRHSSDFWEPNPRQRSHSLNSSILCTRFPISKSEDDRASATWEAQTCVSVTDCSGGECSAGSHQRGQNKAFVPDLLNPPACLSSLPHQRRKNLRQCSLSVLETSTELDPNTDNQAQSLYSLRIPNFKTRNTRESTVTRLPSITNNDTTVRDTHFNMCRQWCSSFTHSSNLEKRLYLQPIQLIIINNDTFFIVQILSFSMLYLKNSGVKVLDLYLVLYFVQNVGIVPHV